MMALLTEPALAARVPPAPTPAAATPPRVVPVLLVPAVPAWVLLVVAVFCVALVAWLVTALGLMVTLLCGIARKVASVFTVVLAFGATDWLAVVLVVLPARFVVLPLLPEPVVVPVAACVLLVVAVFWEADVVWLVVALGAMVTLLCGIALKVASVLTEVLALGATDWVVRVLVLLVAVSAVWANTEPLAAAATTAAMRVSLLMIIGVFLLGQMQHVQQIAMRSMSGRSDGAGRPAPTSARAHRLRRETIGRHALAHSRGVAGPQLTWNRACPIRAAAAPARAPG